MNRIHFFASLVGVGLLTAAACRSEDDPGTPNTPRAGSSGVGGGGGGSTNTGGTAGSGTVDAIETTLDRVNNPNHPMAIPDNARVQVKGLVATSRKFLVSQSKSGSCLWGFYATTPGDTTQEYGSIQVIAFGDDASNVGLGGAGGAGGGSPENTNESCKDGVDNDGNGYTDCKDFSCSKNPEITVCGGTAGGGGAGGAGGGGAENTNDLCSDGISNDGDAFVDCADFDCSKNPEVTVCGGTAGSGGAGGSGGGSAESTNAACSDGIDNDGDKFVDCDDFNCSKNSAVTVCGTGGGGAGGAGGGGGPLRCPSEPGKSGPLPNDIEPGKLVDVIGYVARFKLPNCGTDTAPALAVGQHQLTNSEVTVVGTGTVPAPKEFATVAELNQLGDSTTASDVFDKWGGGLVRMAGSFTIDPAKFPPNAPASTANCAAPFGDMVFAETTLAANNNIYFADLSGAGPRASSKRLPHAKNTTFTAVTGIYSVDFCTWAVSVRGEGAEDIQPAPAGDCYTP